MKENKSILDNRFRHQRFRRFQELLMPSKASRILDVGGSALTWLGSGLESAVTILNTSPPDRSVDGFSYVRGDACDLSDFPDKSFDIVFSNSVVEHVGDFFRQRLMAEEARRVGKGFWVQTPNKHFPIEIHFLFPYLQYMPRFLQRQIARWWPFSFSKTLGLDPIWEIEHIWLLDKKRMQLLFPDGKIIEEKFLGITKSIIAYRSCHTSL
jgi:hypothetical protein